MDKPVYSVVYYKDGKSHQFKCATDSLLDARSLATDCFDKYQTKVEIVKSFVHQEVVDTIQPFSARMVVRGHLEHFDNLESLSARIEFLVNIKTPFQYLGS